MIVLDTNVLSELIRPHPSPEVAAWFTSQLPSAIYTTSITLAEMLYGVERMPKGRRRSDLHSATQRVFTEDFQGRILPCAREAAEIYARIAASRRAIGRPISGADAQIAAIAQVRGATLATRNIADLEHCEIKVLNPWNGR